MRPDDFQPQFASAMVNAIPSGDVWPRWWEDEQLIADWVAMWSGR